MTNTTLSESTLDPFPVLFSAGYSPEFERGKVQIYKRTDYNHADIDYVFENLRAIDRYELAEAGCSLSYARQLVKMASDTYVVFYDGEPVFVGGVHHEAVGRYLVFGVGTDDTPKIIPTVNRYITRHWLPRMWSQGARRFTVRLPVDCDVNLMWLLTIGFKPETRLRDFGVSGVDFYQLTLRPPTHVPFQSPETPSR